MDLDFPSRLGEDAMESSINRLGAMFAMSLHFQCSRARRV